MRRLLVISLLSFRAFSAVAINGSVGAEHYSGPNVTSSSFTYAMSTGANLCLVAIANMGTSGGTPSAITAVWDNGGTNQSMTQLKIIQSGVDTSIVFGLRGPTTGTKSLAFAWTGNAEIFWSAVGLSGCPQTSDATAFPAAGRTSGTSATTISVTSGTGHLVIGGASASPYTANQGTVTGTTVYNDGGANGDWSTAFGNYMTGSSTVSIGSSNTNATVAGVDVAPATGATVTCTLALLGAGPC